MAKAYIGTEEVKKCYMGAVEVDAAFMGSVKACETTQPPQDFEMYVVDPSNRPTFSNVTGTIQPDGRTTLFKSNGPIDSIKLTDDGSGGNGCTITKVTITNCSTVTDFTSFLSDCGDLKSVIFTGTSTSKVKKFDRMFMRCGQLTCLSGLDTTSQTSTAHLFYGSNALVAPNKAEQTALEAGSLYVNPNPCTSTP